MQNRRPVRLWLVQAVSGAVLIALLAVHWIAQHYLVPGGLRDFAAVVDYLANPVVLGLEILFLVCVTLHALLGVRAVILDLDPKPRLRRVLDPGLTVIGIATLLYGLDLLRAILAYR